MGPKDNREFAVHVSKIKVTVAISPFVALQSHLCTMNTRRAEVERLTAQSG